MFEEKADKDSENIRGKANVVFALYFLDETKARQELNELNKKYPQNEYLESLANMMKDIGRKNYIDGVTEAEI